MGQLILIALATFASEDLTCAATGALIAAGRIGFLPGMLACLTGIFVGDLLLYFAGRVVGRPLLRWRPLRRLLTERKLDRASGWLADSGASVAILSRFTPGLRLPTYVAAGLLKTQFWTFASYFLLAAVLWTPLLVGGAALLGKSLPHVVFIGPALLLAGGALRKLPKHHIRRRTIGWIGRRIRWEFWPPWLAYVPVVPYLLYLGIKHRSLTLFTAANPGIPSGGFVGESKSAILAHLPCVPDFRLLPDLRLDAVKAFMAERGLSYPVVLKPDVGERGAGVLIARNDRDVDPYLRSAACETIVQKHVAGVEHGLFYYRYPGDPRGQILSITEKRFPAVVGDGRRTIADLVLADNRAVCLAELYLARIKRDREEVPFAGETVPLTEVGSHCRGAIFLDGAHLVTPALCEAVDRIARSYPGFFFGRFDVRAASIADLKAGRFAILELNGVSAEATHIYDPSVSVIEAYRVLFRQWRIAFEIGARNRKAGYQPLPFRDFMCLIWSRGSRGVRDNVRVPASSLKLGALQS